MPVSKAHWRNFHSEWLSENIQRVIRALDVLKAPKIWSKVKRKVIFTAEIIVVTTENFPLCWPIKKVARVLLAKFNASLLLLCRSQFNSWSLPFGDERSRALQEISIFEAVLDSGVRSDVDSVERKRGGEEKL